ncbi:hypothetical protein [Dactylosporangium sp. NPDC050588]|uniref:hypothetical protein n=1 Tax=Dactylosporangium sp. NPDC050588 TaxID=3157211 RepID=UPI0033FBAD02
MSQDPAGDDEAERWARFARRPHPSATHPGRLRKAVAVYVAVVSAVACAAMTEFGRLDHEIPVALDQTPSLSRRAGPGTKTGAAGSVQRQEQVTPLSLTLLGAGVEGPLAV